METCVDAPVKTASESRTLSPDYQRLSPFPDDKKRDSERQQESPKNFTVKCSISNRAGEPLCRVKMQARQTGRLLPDAYAGQMTSEDTLAPTKYKPCN